MAVSHSHRNVNQRFTILLGPKCYNLLPTEILLINNKKSFLNSIKQYISDGVEAFKNI